MKPVLTRIVSLSFLIALFIPQFTPAATKTFIKEYTYQASEDDSRNSSRIVSLREVKRLLLEELGTYLESETEVKNYQLTKDQITTLTAGIVQAEIVEEKWDGHVYWLKAKIAADSEKVVQSIDALRKDREKTKELEMMRRKSDELLREVAKLQKELASAKNKDVQKIVYDQSIRKLSTKEWLEKGFAAKDRGAFQEAIEAYSRAIELDSSSIEAYYARALISDENHSMQDLHKLLTIEPKDSKSHLYRAWTYKELKKNDLALEEFGKAIDAASGPKERAEAYYDRGKYYYAMSDNSLAIHDYTQAIKLNPKEANYYFYRGSSYSNLARSDLAYTDLSTAIELDPRDSTNYVARAGILLNLMNKPELAIGDYNKAIELEPIAFNYMQRGAAYLLLGKNDLADMDRSKADELYGDDSSQRGNYDFAIKKYGDAINLRSGRAILYYKRALVYTLTGDSKKTIIDLREAIRLDSSYKGKARKDPQFNSIKNHPDFMRLVGK
jgi:tetratricopeptide (TPR) repeat protein